MTGPSPGLPLEQQPGPVVERMNLWAEARGEGPVGMAAVWRVVEHRAGRRLTRRADEVLRRKQFSWTSEPDTVRRALLAYRDDPVHWAIADAVCALGEAGLLGDPTNGATHYYNAALAAPAWGRGHPGWVETAVIGRHVFGRAA